MPIISSIEPQKEKKYWFNVYVNGEFAFAASAETIFREHLATNKEISQETIDKLVKENEYGLLLARTFNWLGSRQHSEKELLEYLHKPNPKTKQTKSERAIAMVITKVKEMGYINDQEFAMWYVASRNRSKPRGRRLLALELTQKGIDRDIIEQVLSDKEQESDSVSNFADGPIGEDQASMMNTEESLAFKAGEKYLSKYKKLEPREFKQKMAQALARRGFDWQTIKPVIDLLLEKR